MEIIDPLKIAREIAATRPDVALAFLENPREPLDKQAIITLDYMQKDNTTPPAKVFDTNCDLVVYDQLYWVERPNYQVENPEKFTLDLAYQNMPYLACKLEAVDCDTRLFSDSFQPLPTVFRNPNYFPAPCIAAYYVPEMSYMRMWLQTTRTIPQAEAPIKVNLVFKCLKMPRRGIEIIRQLPDGRLMAMLAERFNYWAPRSCGPAFGPGGTISGLPEKG